LYHALKAGGLLNAAQDFQDRPAEDVATKRRQPEGWTPCLRMTPLKLESLPVEVIAARLTGLGAPTRRWFSAVYLQ